MTIEYIFLHISPQTTLINLDVFILSFLNFTFLSFFKEISIHIIYKVYNFIIIND